MLRVAHIRAAAVVLAAVVIVASYAWLAIAHGTIWLGNVVVHENGRLTFAGTVWYVEHFIREWPIDILIALCVAAVVRPCVTTQPGARRIAVISTAGAVLLPVVALVVAIERTGWGLVQHDMLQSVTRDGTFAWGSHWHSHWLPMVCWALVATALARKSGFTVSAWVWLGVLTLVFGISTATFTSAQFVGHQLRELVTEAGVMVPVAVAAALVGANGNVTVRGFGGSGGLKPADYGLLAEAAIVTMALGALSLTLGSATAVQPGAGWSSVIAAHVFEHSLDYVWVALIATAAVFWSAARRS